MVVPAARWTAAGRYGLSPRRSGCCETRVRECDWEVGVVGRCFGRGSFM